MHVNLKWGFSNGTKILRSHFGRPSIAAVRPCGSTPPGLRPVDRKTYSTSNGAALRDSDGQPINVPGKQNKD